MFIGVQEVRRCYVIIGYSQGDKRVEMKHNVIENIGDAIKKFGKSRKKDTSATHRSIQTAIVSASARQKRLTTQLAQVVGNSRKTLYKHRKFRMQIDENDELACREIICREPYKDKMGECVKYIIQKYWLEHA